MATKRLLALIVLIAAVARGDEHRARIESLLREHHVPSVAIAVIRDGRVQRLEAYGTLQPGVPARVDALYNVASLTKPIVTMLTLRLVSTGQWQLDEPLARYWTDPDVAADPRTQRLTTRHILTHQTGFPNWRDGKLAFGFEPGTKYQYSGEGFEYLRRALERKFHKTLPELAAKYVFEPFGMRETSFRWSDALDEKRFAHWYDAEGRLRKENFRITSVNAADNLITTVADYGNFAARVMAGGDLAPALFAQMVTPQTAMNPSASMGFGWEVHSGFPNGEYALIHAGADVGVHTAVVLFPKSRQGVVIFTNGDKGDELFGPIVTDTLDLGKELMARQ